MLVYEMGTLYLIPNTLGDCPLDNVLPPSVREVVSSLRHFIVEDVRNCRRFVHKIAKDMDLDEVEFYPLNKHTAPEEISRYAEILFSGKDMGIISEAGCPAIADPGAEIVALAQSRGCKVVPLVGPSSILLSLMASGFNGQSFAFLGYLPIEKDKRAKMLKRMQSRIFEESQSQIFIETPYRNNALLSEIVSVCRKDLKLCVAANITLANEYIRTKTLAEWKKSLPDLNKQACIFLLYK